jgi:hypothetical protein
MRRLRHWEMRNHSVSARELREKIGWPGLQIDRICARNWKAIVDITLKLLVTKVVQRLSCLNDHCFAVVSLRTTI